MFIGDAARPTHAGRPTLHPRQPADPDTATCGSPPTRGHLPPQKHNPCAKNTLADCFCARIVFIGDAHRPRRPTHAPHAAWHETPTRQPADPNTATRCSPPTRGHLPTHKHNPCAETRSQTVSAHESCLSATRPAPPTPADPRSARRLARTPNAAARRPQHRHPLQARQPAATSPRINTIPAQKHARRLFLRTNRVYRQRGPPHPRRPTHAPHAAWQETPTRQPADPNTATHCSPPTRDHLPTQKHNPCAETCSQTVSVHGSCLSTTRPSPAPASRPTLHPRHPANPTPPPAAARRPAATSPRRNTIPAQKHARSLFLRTHRVSAREARRRAVANAPDRVGHARRRRGPRRGLATGRKDGGGTPGIRESLRGRRLLTRRGGKASRACLRRDRTGCS
ncbi:hypothetical protein QE392_002584 [Microbacterium proteolyticum]|nr:hypothetical protein [Microbacterium sp. SORGH_AS_0344]MDQ1170780.1 hypothetical protein [Microbacterium proteolyticum]